MTENGDSTEIALPMKPLIRPIAKPLGYFFARKEVLLCVIFKVRQSANTAHVVRFAVIIYQHVFPLLAVAAIYVQNAISVFATTAPTTANVRNFGERW